MKQQFHWAEAVLVSHDQRTSLECVPYEAVVRDEGGAGDLFHSPCAYASKLQAAREPKIT